MRIVVALGGLLAATNIAWGADLPPPPASAPTSYNWSGFYVGANAGYSWLNGAATASVAGGPFDGVSASESGMLTGGVAGGQIGYNWQFGNLVLGLEGDTQWSGQSAATTTSACGGLCSLSEATAVKWFATGRGRIGIAADRVLFYATGGAAWLNASDNLTASAAGTTANLLSFSDTSIGFAAGAGVEVALTNSVSARIEYLYMQADNFGASANVPIIGGTVTETATLKDSVVRAGLNIRLPVAP